MTKEEALNSVHIQAMREDIDKDLAKEHIRNIYKAFESRTCENCKHNKETDGTLLFCDSGLMWHGYGISFGCNNFEQQRNKRLKL